MIGHYEIVSRNGNLLGFIFSSSFIPVWECIMGRCWQVRMKKWWLKCTKSTLVLKYRVEMSIAHPHLILLFFLHSLYFPVPFQLTQIMAPANEICVQVTCVISARGKWKACIDPLIFFSSKICPGVSLKPHENYKPNLNVNCVRLLWLWVAFAFVFTEPLSILTLQVLNQGVGCNSWASSGLSTVITNNSSNGRAFQRGSDTCINWLMVTRFFCPGVHSAGEQFFVLPDYNCFYAHTSHPRNSGFHITVLS